MEGDKKTFADLNDELLTAAPDTDQEPRRNSKEWLLTKITQLCEEANLELTMSNTKLRRMGKEKLQKLLGELTEEAVKTQMARNLNVNSTDDRVMAVATLRMLHDICGERLRDDAQPLPALRDGGFHGRFEASHHVEGRRSVSAGDRGGVGYSPVRGESLLSSGFMLGHSDDGFHSATCA